MRWICLRECGCGRHAGGSGAPLTLHLSVMDRAGEGERERQGEEREKWYVYTRRKEERRDSRGEEKRDDGEMNRERRWDGRRGKVR